MSIIQVVIVLIVIGVALWLFNQYIPMQPPIKTVINIIVILFIAFWLLRVFGVLGGSLNQPVRRLPPGLILF